MYSKAEYRKSRSISGFKQLIDSALDKAESQGLFFTRVKIPQEIVDKKSYYMYMGILDEYKNDGYIVELQNDNNDNSSDPTHWFFSWY